MPPLDMDDLTEKAWQAEVVRTALQLGWALVYHTFDSRRSAIGFPDLVLCRPPRLIFAELKSEAGRITVAQAEWLEALADSSAESYIWRPSDRPTVDRILARR